MTSESLDLAPAGAPGLAPLRPIAAVLTRPRVLDRVSVVGITLLAFVLNAWGALQSGWGNIYYSAAVRSMNESWSNFFFAAFDPGGFITVDKPPVFLWIGSLTTRVFGYSETSLMLPSAIAGTLAVLLLWLIVRRSFGTGAATLAALVLAVTPIAVAVNRLNLPEPFYILALVAAAGAILRAIESGRRWWAWTITAGVAVGLAFNTKMMAAWIPGPALALALVVGAGHFRQTCFRQTWRRWLPAVAILGIVTLGVSVAWIVAVDATPESLRPYVGGSRDNTETDLIFGYNGFQRVEDRSFRSQGAGGVIAGDPGSLRLFDEANGGQIAWLLPAAVLGGLAALWLYRRSRLHRAALVLWLGWVGLFGVVFSLAGGIYHTYYTAALAPGVAALAGISIASLAEVARHDRRWLTALVLIVLVTLIGQLVVTGRFLDFWTWVRPFAAALTLTGLVIALVPRAGAGSTPRVGAGVAVSVIGLLLLPAAWSASEAAHPPLNATLPQAGPRDGASGATFGSERYENGNTMLAQWLMEHDDPDARWDIAVPNAQDGSSLIATHGLSVMALGGFSGTDPAITLDAFIDRIEAGDVRYVLVDGRATARPRTVLAPTGTRWSGVNIVPLPTRTLPVPKVANATVILRAAQIGCMRVNDPLLTSSGNMVYDCAGRVGTLRSLANPTFPPAITPTTPPRP